MRVAVLSLTRDRLDSTRHCFGTLRENAGCDFDHFVLDQASDDGTDEWLEGYDCEPVLCDENIGISGGMNILLDLAGPGYDVYVKYDNDCELTTAGTLATACAVAHRNPQWIVSPHIHGLNMPPPIHDEVRVSGQRVGTVAQLGGIFMAIPGWVFTGGYRYDEANPIWGMDDVEISRWFRHQGGQLGYLLDYPAFHYETTEGQRRRWPDYFTRKDAEYVGLV